MESQVDNNKPMVSEHPSAQTGAAQVDGDAQDASLTSAMSSLEIRRKVTGFFDLPSEIRIRIYNEIWQERPVLFPRTRASTDPLKAVVMFRVQQLRCTASTYYVLTFPLCLGSKWHYANHQMHREALHEFERSCVWREQAPGTHLSPRFFYGNLAFRDAHLLMAQSALQSHVPIQSGDVLTHTTIRAMSSSSPTWWYFDRIESGLKDKDGKHTLSIVILICVRETLNTRHHIAVDLSFFNTLRKPVDRICVDIVGLAKEHGRGRFQRPLWNGIRHLGINLFGTPHVQVDCDTDLPDGRWQFEASVRT